MKQIRHQLRLSRAGWAGVPGGVSRETLPSDPTPIGPALQRKLFGDQHLPEHGGLVHAIEVEVEVALTLQDDGVTHALPQG